MTRNYRTHPSSDSIYERSSNNSSSDFDLIVNISSNGNCDRFGNKMSKLFITARFSLNFLTPSSQCEKAHETKLVIIELFVIVFMPLSIFVNTSSKDN